MREDCYIDALVEKVERESEIAKEGDSKKPYLQVISFYIITAEIYI